MPNRITRLLTAAEAQLGSIVRTHQLTLDGFDQPMDDACAGNWIVETPPDEVAGILRVEGRDRVVFSALSDSYRTARTALQGVFRAQLASSCDLQVVLGHQRSPEHARKAQLKDIGQFIERLPGDAMFLNALSDEFDNGYVCYLRVLREVSDDQVATRASMRSFRVKYQRISRLKAPFVYALSQQLGSVFSSIGLPEDYEVARRERAAELVNHFPEVER